ncbi:aldehyde dehydrogenase family protein [Nordella sp. HKS 07]|uniref:L-piperidine-6-carboxylate dehydrogenase n=1 Tax=Nordella sp. HKS 07 TaxID=2712222 RepID=UPI0013E1DFDA|nr:aldehyde dehydrogenase family protein [Nordella sp. HKS 07]
MNKPEAPTSLSRDVAAFFAELGLPADSLTAGNTEIHSPITGEVIARVRFADAAEAKAAIGRSAEAFRTWRLVPAPVRGELIRQLGNELRAAKEGLGRLVTIETGKILSEGLGEVQEMIDICDFAVGLSRQLYGLTMVSERADHRLMEQWHPLGPTGVITAFNFPVAVWSWNAALALVCGNPVIWKPSEKTPLTAMATVALFRRAAARMDNVPADLVTLLIGGRDVGEALVDDPRVPLVSATGSTGMGRIVGERLARRFGRAILELGGNNAAILCPSADLDLALRATAFAAIGTAGQRCTSLRRIIVQASVYDSFVPRLKKVYETVAIGNPMQASTLVGPLIDRRSYDAMQKALAAAAAAGGKVHGGKRVKGPGGDDAYYVAPALVEMPAQTGPVLAETFAPILYVMRYENFDEALALHNGVPQGLSSAIFTTDLRESERFLSASGSDCGLANVNMGSSGAEIGGAFGGEKETGGGRESGSDAWKAYMRRVTSAINFGHALPLAQGVKFDI